MYYRLPELLNYLTASHCDGSFRILMKQLKKVSLLILDEWLLTPLTPSEGRDLLEVIEHRYKQNSTIFGSQFSTDGWHSKIGQDTIADAILDRIIHNSYRITIEGKESMRKRNVITETQV